MDELYRQHGEGEMLVWDMAKEDRYWQEAISEPLRKALKEEEDERVRLLSTPTP